MSEQGGYEAEGGGYQNGDGGAQPGGLDKLASSFEKFQTDTFARLDALAQRMPEPEEEPDAFYVDDANQVELGTDYELTDQGALAALEQRVRDEALEHVAGLRDAPSQMEAMAQLEALERRYPELQDPQYQDAFVDEVHPYAHAIGRPDLAVNPVFVERLYLASRAERAGEDETPAGAESGVVLERSAAAGAGAGSQGPSTPRTPWSGPTTALAIGSRNEHDDDSDRHPRGAPGGRRSGAARRRRLTSSGGGQARGRARAGELPRCTPSRSTPRRRV